MLLELKRGSKVLPIMSFYTEDIALNRLTLPSTIWIQGKKILTTHYAKHSSTWFPSADFSDDSDTLPFPWQLLPKQMLALNVLAKSTHLRPGASSFSWTLGWYLCRGFGLCAFLTWLRKTTGHSYSSAAGHPWFFQANVYKRKRALLCWEPTVSRWVHWDTAQRNV